MANLETDRSRQSWFDGKSQRIEQHYFKGMKANFEEKDKYENQSGKTKFDASRPMGSKVSTIAHMFQTLSQQKVDNCVLRSPVSKDAPSLDRVQSPDGYKTERSSSLPAFPHSNCSLSRRGSHLARFNNAKAMFEKLEKNKSVDSKNSAESKPRASTVSNPDCSKIHSDSSKKKICDFNSAKSSESAINNERNLQKKSLNNDNFSKVTAEVLKPIQLNHSKKSENQASTTENKNSFQREDNLYQKTVSQNESNLGTSSVYENFIYNKKNDLIKSDIQKSASYCVNSETLVKSESVLEKRTEINTHYINTVDDKGDKVYDTLNVESKTVSHSSSVNDKTFPIVNDLQKNAINHEHESIDSDGTNKTNENKGYQSDEYTFHQKIKPTLSTECDLVYDSFQSALENSNLCMKSSPFKVQVDNLKNRTFDINSSEEKVSEQDKPVHDVSSDAHSSANGNIFIF